jgi:hypothetical protein
MDTTQEAYIVKSNKELAKSLFEQRVTYKYKKDPRMLRTSNELQKPEEDIGKFANTWRSMILSFSLPKVWESLARSKCKLWDDRELDAIEGFKFFSYFLGMLCYTS